MAGAADTQLHSLPRTLGVEGVAKRATVSRLRLFSIAGTRADRLGIRLAISGAFTGSHQQNISSLLDFDNFAISFILIHLHGRAQHITVSRGSFSARCKMYARHR